MVKMRYVRFVLLLLLIVPLVSSGQVLRLPPYTTSGQFLEQQIIADTGSAEWKAKTRIYELQRDGLYLTQTTFAVRGGRKLFLQANDSAAARPRIMLYPSATTGNPTLPWNLTGGDIELRNVIVTGYFEPVDTNIRNLQGNIIRVQTTAGGNITVDSCILKSSSGQIIRTEAATANIKVTNSVFADMGFLKKSDLGAGKFIDLREVSCDTLIITNNTFVNFQDRIIRHYNLSGVGATLPINYLKFDHNTLVNGMSFHGLLSLGSLGDAAIITNNLLLDPFALGEDTTNTVRGIEFGRTNETYPNGNNRLVWTFSAPNSTTTWDVRNNYWALSDSGQAFLNEEAAYLRDSIAVIGVDKLLGPGSPLSYHIYSKVDSATAFIKLSSLSFGNIPSFAKMLRLCRWYLYYPSYRAKLNSSALFVDSLHHYDRKSWEYYDGTLDCSFYSSVDLSHAGTDGQIIGDTRWTWKGIVHGAFVASPTAIDFDSVVVGASKVDSVFVTNTGAYTALVLDTVKSTSAEFTVTPASANIAVGGTQKFTVTFTPASIGSKSASIVFIQNAAAQKDTVAVSGAGKTSVGVTDAELNLPKVYQLHNNYPNPFNPSTVISYDLPCQSKVVLRVYSLLGQEVATLVDGVQEAGYYHMTWGTQRNGGKSLASGVYLFRISAHSTAKAGRMFVQVKKMLLIK
jgi:hypothetical protein